MELLGYGVWRIQKNNDIYVLFKEPETVEKINGSNGSYCRPTCCETSREQSHQKSVEETPIGKQLKDILTV